MVRCADTCEHGVPPFYVLFDTSCVLWSIGVTPLSDSALISIPHCALSLRLHSAHALRQRVLLIYVRAFAPRFPPPTCATALVSR